MHDPQSRILWQCLWVAREFKLLGATLAKDHFSEWIVSPFYHH